MAGFAVLFEANTTPKERENNFRDLLALTCRFKDISLPGKQIEARSCTGAKLDAHSSLHRGISYEDKSGSWLMVAGTVFACEGDNDPKTLPGRLLRNYLLNGTEAFENFDGHYSIAAYNHFTDELSIITDPLGLMAVYFAQQGQQVLISCSALAIAQQINARPDEMTIECFLRTGRPFVEKTFWQGVRRIPPATEIIISPSKIRVREYWTPKIDEGIARLSLDEALNVADEKICRNFDRALRREGQVWADLTGGYDTRLTTMYLEKLGIPFTAYCVGPKGHPDVEISKLVSSAMDWPYRAMHMPANWDVELKDWLDFALGKCDGLLNVFQVASVLHSANERSSSASVSISGMGADEWRYHIFGANYLNFNTINKVDFDQILDAKIVENIPIQVMRHDRTADVRSAIKSDLYQSVSKYLGSAKITQIDIAFLRYRHPVHTGAFASAQAGLIRSISPFCFKELENFCLSLNHQWRVKYDSRFVRHLFERVNPKLANIRTEKGDPILPFRLMSMHRFAPLILFLADHQLGKITKRMVGRRIALHKLQEYPTYPLPAWKTTWLNWAVGRNFVDPDRMLSGNLYNGQALMDLVTDGKADRIRGGEFLDRLITVEMALQASGTTEI